MPQVVSDWLRSGWCGAMILGVSVLIRGFFYAPPVVPDGHRIPALEQWMPVHVWAWVWLIVGVVTIIAAVARRFLPQIIGASTALYTLWAVMYLCSWAFGDSSRGYVTALSYFTIAMLVIWAYWRGQRDEVMVKIRRE